MINILSKTLEAQEKIQDIKQNPSTKIGTKPDVGLRRNELHGGIKEKKECYRRLYHDKSVDNIEKYKVTKKTAKRAVSVAKGRAYVNLYQHLNTKERRTFIGWLGFVRERQGTSTKLSALRMKRSISW